MVYRIIIEVQSNQCGMVDCTSGHVRSPKASPVGVVAQRLLDRNFGLCQVKALLLDEHLQQRGGTISDSFIRIVEVLFYDRSGRGIAGIQSKGSQSCKAHVRVSIMRRTL